MDSRTPHSIVLVIRHVKNVRGTGLSKVSQRLLGLLLARAQ